MKDSLKWWSILFIAILSVYVTSHFAASSISNNKETTSKIDSIEGPLKELVELGRTSSEYIKTLPAELESLKVQLDSLEKSNDSVLRLLRESSHIDNEAMISNHRPGFVRAATPDSVGDDTKLAEAIYAFDQRKQEFRKLLEPGEARMLEGLRDSTVDMIFQNTELVGIETPEQLREYKEELRESGELRKMYEGIESAILGDMMLEAIGNGSYSLFPDSPKRDEGTDVE